MFGGQWIFTVTGEIHRVAYGETFYGDVFQYGLNCAKLASNTFKITSNNILHALLCIGNRKYEQTLQQPSIITSIQPTGRRHLVWNSVEPMRGMLFRFTGFPVHSRWIFTVPRSPNGLLAVNSPRVVNIHRWICSPNAPLRSKFDLNQVYFRSRSDLIRSCCISIDASGQLQEKHLSRYVPTPCLYLNPSKIYGKKVEMSTWRHDLRWPFKGPQCEISSVASTLV